MSFIHSSGDFDELTVEEQVAINNCKGLRRAPVLIEDMRPVDSSSSTLEYSYRPMDKISQFWAGPSHWKFKKSRNKSLSLAQRFSANHTGDNRKQNLRGKRKPLKFRTQPLEFLEIHDNLFQKLDEKSKMRKANIQKKWDAKRMKLPTDLQINKDIFDIYSYSLGTQVMEEVEAALSPDIPDGSDYDNPNSEKFCDDIPNVSLSGSMHLDQVFYGYVIFAGRYDGCDGYRRGRARYEHGHGVCQPNGNGNCNGFCWCAG